MIEIKAGEEMDKAVERAKAARLLVQAKGLREYQVTNRATGAAYAVNFFVAAGRKYAECVCTAGQHGRLCKHVAAAVGLHVMRAAEAAKTSATAADAAPMIRPTAPTAAKFRGVRL